MKIVNQKYKEKLPKVKQAEKPFKNSFQLKTETLLRILYSIHKKIEHSESNYTAIV